MADDSSSPNPTAAAPTGVPPAQSAPTGVKPAEAAVKPLPPPRLPPSPERAAVRRRFLDGMLVAVVLAFAFLISLFSAHNSDFLLHAATGRLIAHGDLRPMTGVDPFAFTSNGVYWANTNWLYDLIVYLFYDTSAVGGTILIVLKALMIAALAEVMLRTAREPGRSLWGAGLLRRSGRACAQSARAAATHLRLLFLPRSDVLAAAPAAAVARARRNRRDGRSCHTG